MSPVVMSVLTLASLWLFSSEDLGEEPHTGLWGVVCHFLFATGSNFDSSDNPSHVLVIKASVTFGI